MSENRLNKKTIYDERLTQILGEDFSNAKLETVAPFERMVSFDENITNFNKVREKAWDIESNSCDFNVNLKDLYINKDMRLADNRNKMLFDFSHWSLSQFCSSLDIPARYIKKCMVEDPELAVDNLNTWLTRASDKECLLRTTSNRLSGFLSNKYTIFEDTDLMDIIHNSLKKEEEYIVMEHLITPEILNLRIVRSRQLNIAGEDLSVGINVRNSRVGKSKVDIELLIYKWKCTNGIIFGGGVETYYSKRHTGIDSETIASEFSRIMSDMPKNIELIKSKVETLRSTKINENILEKFVDKFEKNKFANSAMTQKILASMPKYEDTGWGFVNAMTEVAQEYNMDTRERIEKYAGQLLTA